LDRERIKASGDSRASGYRACFESGDGRARAAPRAFSRISQAGRLPLAERFTGETIARSQWTDPMNPQVIVSEVRQDLGYALRVLPLT
jgi:hypothetical protein